MAVLSLRLLPTYCQFFLGVLVPEGVRDLSAQGTHLSLLPATLQPSGAPGPSEALLDSSQWQQEEGG